MGMRSTFIYEEDIYFHDKELYEYCKLIMKDKNRTEKKDNINYTAEAIVEWYDKNKKTNSEEFPKFSFECFDNWKTQGYWYNTFCEMLNAMGKFLNDKTEKDYGNVCGCAKFEYEEGQPFKFILNYKMKEIYCEYTPLLWEKLRFNKSKILTKIPQKILDDIKSNEVLEKI